MDTRYRSATGEKPVNDTKSVEVVPPMDDLMRELSTDDLGAVNGGIRRSIPNGKTDVIKVMGNTKWDDRL